MPEAAKETKIRRAGRSATRVLLSLALVAVMAACSCQMKTDVEAAAQPAAAQLSEEEQKMLNDFRDEAKELIRVQMEMSWKNRIAGEPVDYESTYRGHDKLFSKATVKLTADAAAQAGDPATAKAYRFFKGYLLGELIAKRIAALDDEITNFKSQASFTWDGEKQAYYAYHSLIANEPEYRRRQGLSDAVLPVIEQLNPKLEQKMSRAREIASEMGYGSYIELSEELRDVRFEAFAPLCEQFLDETDELYRELLRDVVPRMLGFPAEQMRRADISRLFRNMKYEGYFPEERMTPAMREFLLGLGFDLERQTNITVNDDKDERKNPRAACYPMDVPGDIRLTIKPIGGSSDYRSFWHEMGHTQHHAYTTTDVFEFQHLGNNTSTETYAFLFEGMMENRHFLKKYLAMDAGALKGYMRFAAFGKLYMVRRYAAKTLYELRLHGGNPDAREAYRTLLSRAYGFELDPNDALRYLVDVDDFFYSADYTRAWFLEAMLGARLEEGFGKDWFADPAAGERLKELWAVGNMYDADDMARELGYEGIDPSVLVEKIRTMAGMDG